MLESWLLLFPLKGNWQINTTFSLLNITSNSKNRFQKPSRYLFAESGCKGKVSFLNFQIFWKLFSKNFLEPYFCLPAGYQRESGAKVRQVFLTSKFLKNFFHFFENFFFLAIFKPFRVYFEDRCTWFVSQLRMQR